VSRIRSSYREHLFTKNILPLCRSALLEFAYASYFTLSLNVSITYSAYLCRYRVYDLRVCARDDSCIPHLYLHLRLLCPNLKHLIAVLLCVHIIAVNIDSRTFDIDLIANIGKRYHENEKYKISDTKNMHLLFSVFSQDLFIPCF